MKRAKLNIIVDIFSLIFFIASVFTGLVPYLFLPRGGYYGGRVAETFWGLTRTQWGNIHFLVSLIFVILMVIHLLLHWEWWKKAPSIFRNC